MSETLTVAALRSRLAHLPGSVPVRIVDREQQVGKPARAVRGVELVDEDGRRETVVEIDAWARAEEAQRGEAVYLWCADEEPEGAEEEDTGGLNDYRA